MLFTLVFSVALPGTRRLPSVVDAREVLRNFRGEYSYGGLGLGAESNDGELALWVITHSHDASKTLTELYPECSVSGKAYILAALYHLNRKTFRALTNDFCQDVDLVAVGSGCIGWTVSRPELIAAMQNRKSPLTFLPARKPVRRSAMTFTGDDQDVYEEQRREARQELESKQRAFNSLLYNPALAQFTNLFHLDDLEEANGYVSGVYFSGTEQWRGDLLPRTALNFDGMVEVVFPSSNGVVHVGLDPVELFDELRRLTELPFLKQLDEKLPISCVRIRAAGDRFHWDSSEAAPFEATLRTGVPLRDWVHFIVDVGVKPRKMISFYHPRNTDLYVVEHWLFENPNWREQYRKLTGKKPKKNWESPDSKYVPVVDKTGRLKLVSASGEP
ncbi:MAG: hypothetical protein U1F83_08135 [Verrucomicrobiota bacterium]